MTKDQLYAHYKATAPGVDLLFFANAATLEQSEQTEIMRLRVFCDAYGRLSGIPRAAFYQRLKCLQDSWRRRSSELARVERLGDVARESEAA